MQMRCSCDKACCARFLRATLRQKTGWDAAGRTQQDAHHTALPRWRHHATTTRHLAVVDAASCGCGGCPPWRARVSASPPASRESQVVSICPAPTPHASLTTRPHSTPAAHPLSYWSGGGLSRTQETRGPCRFLGLARYLARVPRLALCPNSRYLLALLSTPDSLTQYEREGG